MPVPYTFGTATSSIPLSQLDSNFATAVTIGNTAVQLGNTVTTLNNLTLANVTISSGNVTITNVSVTTANVSGTANVSSLVVLTNETVLGNTAVTGNVTASINVTGAKLIPTGTSVTGNGLYLPAANALGLSTNGTNAVYIDASQNVGIGTTSPAAKLDVRGSSTFLVNATNPTAWISVDSGLTTGSVYSQWNTTSSIGITGTYTNHPYTFVTNNTERMRLDTSGNLLFNSGYGSVATAYGCRAWVNFNGTGTVAIRASGNVTSITDNGTGDYTVNFTTSMPDANYSAQGTCGVASSQRGSVGPESYSTSAFRCVCVFTVPYDPTFVNIAIFR